MTLQHATNYLVDLIQAFGQRSIVAHTYKDGEEVKIWAKDFVRRRLTSTGMKFPYHEMNKLPIPDFTYPMISLTRKILRNSFRGIM